MKTYRGLSRQRGNKIVETPTGDFLVAAAFYTAASADIGIVKTNSTGGLVWGWQILGAQGDLGHDVASTSDGGGVVVGQYYHPVYGTSAFIAKFSTAGPFEWARLYTGSSVEVAFGVKVNSEGDIFMIGYTTSNSYGLNDVLIVKVGADGSGDCLLDFTPNMTDATTILIEETATPAMKDIITDFNQTSATYQFTDPQRNTTCQVTLAPTSEPTAIPTDNPTPEPTDAPTTSAPTAATDQPSLSPTSAPTAATSEPSESPTYYPTESPTYDPTESPTYNPTESPTRYPSVSPTRNPSDSPTRHPSDSPTRNPSDSPTRHPSDSPTRNPSDSPTRHPSDSPTRNPSDSPTRYPSLSPTESPTLEPTMEPTTMPTMEPTELPTAAPTDAFPLLTIDLVTTSSKGGDSSNDFFGVGEVGSIIILSTVVLAGTALLSGGVYLLIKCLKGRGTGSQEQVPNEDLDNDEADHLEMQISNGKVYTNEKSGMTLYAAVRTEK